MENTPSPPNLIKIISRFANFYGRLFFNWLLVQLSTNKIIEYRCLILLTQLKCYIMKKQKFVNGYYFNVWTFGLLAVKKFFAIFKSYQDAYFHDNNNSDDGYFMVNCGVCGEWNHKKWMNITAKFLWDGKYHMQ